MSNLLQGVGIGGGQGVGVTAGSQVGGAVVEEETAPLVADILDAAAAMAFQDGSADVEPLASPGSLSYVMDLTVWPKEVQALCEQYGITALDRPMERVLLPAARLNELMKSGATVDELAKGVSSRDARRGIMHLEELLRAYGSGSKEAKALFKRVKELEDAIGDVTTYTKAADKASELKASPEAVQYLRDQGESARLALCALIAESWQAGEDGTSPAINRLVEGLSQMTFLGVEEDRSFHLQGLVDELAKIQATPYAMDDLEHGVHEERRDLRKFETLAEAYDGLVQMSPNVNPLPEFAPLNDDPEVAKKVKYREPPAPQGGERPIVASKSLHLRLLQVIDEFGEVKDDAELRHRLAEAYLATNPQTAPLHAVLVQLEEAKEALVDGFRPKSATPREQQAHEEKLHELEAAIATMKEKLPEPEAVAALVAEKGTAADQIARATEVSQRLAASGLLAAIETVFRSGLA